MTPVLNVENICKKYVTKNGVVCANDNISFSLGQNEILAVLGPNGAGKSTLIKQIIGYVSPDSGKIEINGVETGSKSKMLSEISYMMQSRFEHWDHLTVYDAIYYSARLKKMSKADTKREIEYLAAELDLKKEMRKLLKNLSGGKKQAAALACAVVANPKILILDEPTTGLDPEKKVLFWNFLRKIQKEKETSILLITHNVAEVEEIVDRVIIVSRGKIIEKGTPESLHKQVQDEIRIEITLKEKVDEKVVENVLEGYSYKLLEKKIIVYIREENLVSGISKIFDDKELKDYIDDFRVVRPSLEDVYIKLMGEKIA
ncbi:ABC transporter ATP-binding protein [Butyrivibrio sp. YAB3001]|uniref:ABC transporter ATP-binding protein n=1 Tax=Butyrivibrio sp. YAB3001 TaxID=1520812 RepID=UPI0008F6366F|nr:ABC transporter ATP-binding protein [Butyrivibrio sp. YAB3001]SFC21162.1 ABC-2 type transport system ATP-binding protein [Butyrivibrio sp. YAB3001]